MNASPPSSPSPTKHCLRCGCALDGLVDPRCPECGQPFDPANARTFKSGTMRKRGAWETLFRMGPPPAAFYLLAFAAYAVLIWLLLAFLLRLRLF